MKPFIVVTLATEEQNVSIMPTEDREGIILQTKEVDNTTVSNSTYLSKIEAVVLIEKIQEMIKYLEL